ncbi:MAG: peptidyl-prolyl cis-trans isomerase [Alphaproteobacteria bacterium]|nr:peptidyl-prolyl cis-trans isomerase [Alphaproteobacteria bacterium]
MSQRTAITVNGVALTPQTIAAEAQHHSAKTPAAAYAAAARALVIRTLMLQECERLGVHAEPELVSPGKREIDDEARMRVMLETSVPIIEAEGTACRAYYDANKDRFCAPDLFEASHILFAADPGDESGYLQAVTQAMDAIGTLSQNPAVFETLAREKSDCDSRGNGGRLGQITSGTVVPEFETFLYALDEGQIAAVPVETHFGAHVLRLDRRVLGQILPFEYVRERIGTYLTERDWRGRLTAYIDKLVEAATIEGIDLLRYEENAIS